MVTTRRTGDARGNDSTAPDSERIAVGIIRKPHGVRGEASVEPWTDSPERFAELEAVLLVSPDEEKTRPSRIESTRPHAGRALVKFEGVDSPEELEAIRNWTIEIPRGQSRSLDEGEYFLHDLIGLAVVNPAGFPVGTILDAYEGGGGILLTLQTPERGSFDVPFAAEICTEIDLTARRMTMVLPDGLDDLGALPAVEDEARKRRAAGFGPGASKRGDAE